MKKFEIPHHYRSNIISRIKEIRKEKDPRKKDYSPTILDFGSLSVILARHFGFCYGVENAIEIAYKTIEENPGKSIYMLSEMIHNPGVNKDLVKYGVKFLMDTTGELIEDWDKLSDQDIVIVPAFGTTIEIEKILEEKGINPYRYNTTCPFVEKVWKTASGLGSADFTVIIHGKHYHEETRATFSHSVQNAPSVIVRDLEETKLLVEFINGKRPEKEFYVLFKERYSEGFEVKKDLKKVGVVNQTTMLASETEEIADLLRQVMAEKFGPDNLKDHYADTRDTLCYATNDNQKATSGLLGVEADFAIVIGGYNSSNTTHLVELLQEKHRTYFISSAEKVISKTNIRHYSLQEKKEVVSENYIPANEKVKVIITSGASCPDSEVNEVIVKMVSYFKNSISFEQVLDQLNSDK